MSQSLQLIHPIEEIEAYLKQRDVHLPLSEIKRLCQDFIQRRDRHALQGTYKQPLRTHYLHRGKKLCGIPYLVLMTSTDPLEVDCGVCRNMRTFKAATK
jgi:hypothetical protein